MYINWSIDFKKCYICIMEYDSAMKMNKVLLQAATWMNFENIIPGRS